MKFCQNCHQELSATDVVVDRYTQLCKTCWEVWRVEAGQLLERYGQPGTVCTACGMGFGGTVGFDRHRQGGHCLSPAELKAQNRPLTIKHGIWVDAYRGNAKISLGERPNGDFAGEGISTPHPAFSIAKMALPCGLNGISQPGD